MKDSGRFVKRKNFSMVSNYILHDKSISLKAKGLYSLIQSYITIDGFVLYKSFLKEKSSDGKKAFDSAWNELKKSGYLLQYRKQDHETKRFYWEYELIDDPKALRGGFIYVMECMGVFKIGRTNKKAARLGEYTHLPEKPIYRIFKYVKDNVVVEREIHEMFSEKRCRNGNCEWFDLSEEDLVTINNFLDAYTINIPEDVNINNIKKMISNKEDYSNSSSDSNNTNFDSLKDYLVEVSGKKLFKDEQKELKDTLFSYGIRSRSMGINTINKLLIEKNINYEIVSSQETKGNMRKKRYWILNPVA